MLDRVRFTTAVYKILFLCITIEHFRDEREGEFHGTDGEEHEHSERTERETVRQDRVNIAKLSSTGRKTQLYPVAFGWS